MVENFGDTKSEDLVKHSLVRNVPVKYIFLQNIQIVEHDLGNMFAQLP